MKCQILRTSGTESAAELLERATSTSNGNGNGNGSSPARFDGRAFRRSLNKTGRYVRQPIDDAESLALMEEHGVGYSSTGLIARMRQNGNVWQEGVRHRPFASDRLVGARQPKQACEATCCPAQEVKVKLAQAYGYCWGVERAVQMAYEARKQYPKARVHVTNEIIHNPAVNQVRLSLACPGSQGACPPAAVCSEAFQQGSLGICCIAVHAGRQEASALMQLSYLEKAHVMGCMRAAPEGRWTSSDQVELMSWVACRRAAPERRRLLIYNSKLMSWVACAQRLKEMDIITSFTAHVLGCLAGRAAAEGDGHQHHRGRDGGRQGLQRDQGRGRGHPARLWRDGAGDAAAQRARRADRGHHLPLGRQGESLIRDPWRATICRTRKPVIFELPCACLVCRTSCLLLQVRLHAGAPRGH